MGAAALAIAAGVAPAARADEAGTARSGEAAGDPRQELLDRYAPEVVVRTQPTACGEGEAYLPMPVDPLFGRDGVVLRGPGGVAVGAPTEADLAEATGDDWYLDLPGNALRPGCSYERFYDRLVSEQGISPTVYGRVATDAERPGRLMVQYWFFYLYNDWNDRHEGDWEMVQLQFDAADAEDALASSPTLAAYAQHEGAQVSDWTDDDLEVDGTHPVVYVGEGSHAAYFSSRRWFGKSAQSGFGCDDTLGPSTTVQPRVVLLDDASLPAWLAYPGHWGEHRPSFNNGPTGPANKAKWLTPVRWVDDEGRRGAVSLPAGGSEVTDFFCAATAWGSKLMFQALDRPQVVLGAGLVVLVALVVLFRRTRWSPVHVHPITQRRRAGQVLRAGVRVVRRRPLWFASIGALLIVSGAVATLLQMVLLRTTELGDLADVADRQSAWGAFVGIAVGLLVVVPATGVVTLMICQAVLRFDEPRPPRRRELLVSAVHRPQAVLIQFAVGAIVVVGGLSVVLVVPALWAVSRWAVAMPAAADGHAPARRSAELTKGRRVRSLALLSWSVLLVSVVPAFVGVVVLLIFDASFGVVNLVASAVSLVTVPAAAVSTTLQYLDLKVAAAESAALASA